VESSTVIIIFIVAGVALWVFTSKRKERRGLRGGTPVILVGRPIPPASNVLKNIMVLAILGGLAWFFWWATHTKFWP
jgi:hypothetical protein